MQRRRTGNRGGWALALGVAALAVVAFAGCTASDDPKPDDPPPELSADEQAYADSLGAWFLEANEELPADSDLHVTQEQATCVGARFADSMGIDRLERYIPRDDLNGEDDQWGDADIRLEDDEVQWMLRAQRTCGVDEKDYLAAAMTDPEDTEQRACIRKELDTALGQRMVELQWGGGDDEEYEQVYRDFFEALTEKCLDE